MARERKRPKKIYSKLSRPRLYKQKRGKKKSNKEAARIEREYTL